MCRPAPPRPGLCPCPCCGRVPRDSWAKNACPACLLLPRNCSLGPAHELARLLDEFSYTSMVANCGQRQALDAALALVQVGAPRTAHTRSHTALWEGAAGRGCDRSRRRGSRPTRLRQPLLIPCPPLLPSSSRTAGDAGARHPVQRAHLQRSDECGHQVRAVPPGAGRVPRHARCGEHSAAQHGTAAGSASSAGWPPRAARHAFVPRERLRVAGGGATSPPAAARSRACSTHHAPFCGRLPANRTPPVPRRRAAPPTWSLSTRCATCMAKAGSGRRQWQVSAGCLLAVRRWAGRCRRSGPAGAHGCRAAGRALLQASGTRR